MKKTIITAIVAVSAFGFSGTSFAGGAAAAAPDLLSNNDLNVDFSSSSVSNTFSSTLNNSFTSEVDEEFSVDTSINAEEDGPAAGGNLQVAYDAPAVGGDMITVNASAIAVQLGDVASTYPELAFLGSGGVIAGSGAGAAAADASFGGAAAAGGDSGNVTVTSTTGAVSTGAVTIDLSNTATALAVGGSYNYNVAP